VDRGLRLARSPSGDRLVRHASGTVIGWAKNLGATPVQPLDQRRSNQLDHAPVRDDIGAAKPVDRLLGISHDRQLPRRQGHGVPGIARRALFTQKHHDLGLERIGILKLVDEHVIEQTLTIGAHHEVVAQQVTQAE
jgi:hypothetical protein